MPTVTVSVELSDEEAAGMAALGVFFGMTAKALLADALRFGLNLRRAEYEQRDPAGEQPPPAPPAPELLREAKAFTDEIGALLEADDASSEPLRFTITVPRAQAIMGAWVMLKEATRYDGHPVELRRPVMLHLDDGRRGGDWDRAKRYFQRAIFYEFDTDYTNLQMQTHSLLFPPPPKRKPRDWGGIEDDIPF